MFDELREFLADETVRDGAKATAILLAGVLASRFVDRRLRSDGLQTQARLLLRRALTALMLGISLTWALSALGLNVGVLLGAAGILTVAIGFASQTSVSNLISGMFLVAERPFRVGDIIHVDGITGELLAVDLLSIKIRTFDNLLVRIPNEIMIKAKVTNVTHFAIRRYDLQLGVAYKEDIGHVRKVLFAVAEENPLCLKEPKPMIIFQGFGDSSINLQFSVWVQTGSYLELRNTISEEIKRAFDRAGIEIPYPHRSLQAAANTAVPLSVRIVGADVHAGDPAHAQRQGK